MANQKMLRKKVSFSMFLLILSLSICFGFGGVEEFRAEEETEKSEEEIIEKIKAQRNSIVHIESICWDGSEEVYRKKSFSGFVVSGDTTGIYVITVNNQLAYSSKEKETVKIEYELDNNVRISEKIEVIFDGDLRVKADIVGESEQRNLTVLRLEQSVHFENVLQFAEKNASDKEQIFLLSYPETDGRNKAVFHTENVMITSGNVLNSYLSNEIIFFKHDIQTDGSSIGGPLLDLEGHAVGMLLTSSEEKEGTAVSCDALKTFLDAFNVSYQEYEKTVTEKKVPILNIVLGIIIFILFLLIVIQRIRSSHPQDANTDQASSNAVKNTEKKNTQGKAGKSPTQREMVNAVLEYPAQKRAVMVHKEMFLIGRDSEADFIIAENKGISRKHASIQFDGKNFYLTDLRSTNHTFLNGSELMPDEKKVLTDADEIIVGKEKLIFRRK